MSRMIYNGPLLTEEERDALRKNFFDADRSAHASENDRVRDLATIAVNARVALAAVLAKRPVDADSLREIIKATERLRRFG